MKRQFTETVDAAVRQVKAIRILDEHIGIDTLPDKLKVVARFTFGKTQKLV